jgi:ribose transport system substrate-binding protein
MKRFSLLAIAALGSCGDRPREEVIAVIPKGTTHEFWKSVHAGARKAARELGVKIVWQGPLKEDDREEQIKVVETFVNRGVRGIVLAPLDDTALRGPVSSAVARGIPVVIIDSDLKSEDHVSFVATDNYAGGKLAAAHMAELLGAKGRVVLLRYVEGSASTAQREKGFLDGIAERPGIAVVSSNQYGGATTETAAQASELLLGRYKTETGLAIDGIFCPNESTAFGMLLALKNGGFAGKVRFIGFDSSPKLVEALERGHLDATVVQDPLSMGYLGVKTMVAHLRGERPARRIDTGARLVTRSNMSDPPVKALLQPEFEKWLKD